jgi:hypothetical protein
LGKYFAPKSRFDPAATVTLGHLFESKNAAYMKTNWEKRRGDSMHYVQFIDQGLVVGEFHIDDDVDDGGGCTLTQFLEGRFQDIVLREHGPVVLAEVVAGAQARLGVLPHGSGDLQHSNP